MSEQIFDNRVDETIELIGGFIKENGFDKDVLTASLCRMYCQQAADQQVSPDFFLRITMAMFAALSGGEFVVVSPDEMEAMEQKDGATLQ